MQRKAPVRTCIACGAQGDKGSLLRCVKSPDGLISFDVTGKAAGRGAYICRDEACFKAACKKRLFDSRLRTKVGAAGYEQLEREFRTICAQGAEQVQ